MKIVKIAWRWFIHLQRNNFWCTTDSWPSCQKLEFTIIFRPECNKICSTWKIWVFKPPAGSVARSRSTSERVCVYDAHASRHSLTLICTCASTESSINIIAFEHYFKHHLCNRVLKAVHVLPSRTDNKLGKSQNPPHTQQTSFRQRNYWNWCKNYFCAWFNWWILNETSTETPKG